MNNAKKELTILGYSCLAIIGSLFLIWGIYSAFDLAFNGVHETGVIVKYERVKTKGGITHAHEVKINEELIRVVLDNRNEIGTKVTLKYLPNRPNAYSVEDRLSTPVSSLFGGMLMLIIGIVGVWYEKN